MPPERVRGQDSPTVDVYGLGLVLANLLTGQPHPELPKSEDEQPEFNRVLGEQLNRLKSLIDTGRPAASK